MKFLKKKFLIMKEENKIKEVELKFFNENLEKENYKININN